MERASGRGGGERRKDWLITAHRAPRATHGIPEAPGLLAPFPSRPQAIRALSGVVMATDKR